MEKLETITIKQYFDYKGIAYKEANGELITKCLFNNCDDDSRDGEAHLYFNIETGQYDCKKCGEQGNIITLAKRLGDDIKDIAVNNFSPKKQTTKAGKSTKIDPALIKKCHQELPERIRQYLNQRGIINELIIQFKLGYGKFYGKFWITIPVMDIDGNFLFLKLRRDPEDNNNPNKFKFYPVGSETNIYGLSSLKNNDDVIVICEGEFDCLLLYKNGIQAITSTGGAGTFKIEWIEHLKSLKKIYICFDKDEAGDKGAEKLIKNLSQIEGLKIFKITLPDIVGKGGDITDYFIKHKGNINDLFHKYAKEVNFKKINRVARIDKPNKEINFKEWQEIIEFNFPELLFSSEMGLSVIAQILIKDITNPFALVLVDVPAAGKTISINFFSEIPELTYATDKFTPASFVSNAVNVKKEKLKEIDLLPRLQYKMFLIRDLATLFSKRDDDLTECLGILTRILDGEGLTTDSGIHGQRQYVGEYLFMILAGSTPIPPKVWKMMGNLGSRLFFLNLHSKEKSEEELADQLITTHKEKENTCRIATKNFLYTLWHNCQEGIDWDKTEDKQEYRFIIARCAKLLSKLRGTINVWKKRADGGAEYSYNSPVIEQPNRINQLFYNLCRGHALISGRTQINKNDLRLIIELAIDSVPTIRARLFKKLLDNNGIMKTSEIEIALQCSKTTALKEMEMLKILDVCDIIQDSHGKVGGLEKKIHLVKNFRWFLDDDCKKMRGMPVK